MIKKGNLSIFKQVTNFKQVLLCVVLKCTLKTKNVSDTSCNDIKPRMH